MDIWLGSSNIVMNMNTDLCILYHVPLLLTTEQAPSRFKLKSVLQFPVPKASLSGVYC